MLSDVARLEMPELIRRYRASVAAFDGRVFALDDAQLDQAFLPEAGCGRWPVRVLLGHLADTEMVLTHRIRRAAAQPGSVIEIWDEDAFIDSGLYAGPESAPKGVPALNDAPPQIGAFVGAVYTMRQWMGEWLGTLSESVWSNEVLHPERGPVSLRDFAVYNVWHLEHHADFLARKVKHFLGEMPVESCQPGGCGTGCGCVPHDGGEAQEPTG